MEGKIYLYDLRKVLRFRLTNLVIEAKQRTPRDEVALIDKYEALIYEEVKRFFKK